VLVIRAKALIKGKINRRYVLPSFYFPMSNGDKKRSIHGFSGALLAG
jgi:hypothetical protein